MVTRLGYCDCGTLFAITNAWNTPVQQVTTFAYDYQGNRTYAYLPDATVTNWFNAMAQVYQTGDGHGTRYLYYNNQGLRTNLSNVYGTEQAVVYDNEDRPLYLTDANGVTVTNSYDLLGRLIVRGYPDGGTEHFTYTARGLVAYTNQIGMGATFAYDPAGRKTFETNADNQLLRYTNNPAGDLLSLTDGKGQTTRWNYDGYGRVTNKLDQAGNVILQYAHDPDGRLVSRWSAARGTTYYTNDPVGNLTYTKYPSSPAASFQYDWLDRLTNMVDAAGTTTYTYAMGGQMLSEDGPFANDTVTNGYVNRVRVSLGLQQPTGTWTNLFGYDPAGRLTNVTSPAGAFGYDFSVNGVMLPGSLVRRLSLPNSSYVTNVFDTVSRLASTSLKNSSGAVLDSAAYGVNLAGWRTAFTNTAGTSVAFQYDSIGQLQVANSSVSTENRGYTYDPAWNLLDLTNNGSLSTFLVDNRNELTNANSSTLAYDLNGNPTNYAGWLNYTYDDENRLTQASDDVYHSFRTALVYDGLGRLRERIEYYYGTIGPIQMPAWRVSGTVLYIYDGNRVIQERDANNNPTVSYTRGADLSGGLEGAGGIGGLLARSSGYSGGNWTNHAYYLDSSQSLVASYRYDPFGNTTASSGSLASANVYRFSSKEFLTNSALYCYLYRFYAPNLLRWLNSDPLGEPGFEAIRKSKGHAGSYGPNLYTFVRNGGVGTIDPLGLKIWVCTVRTSGFPFGGVGRHAYFWDDRPGTAKGKRECGKEGSSGYGGHSSDNIGPSSGETSNPWNGSGPKGESTCYPVNGSDGKEQAVMDCCDKNANKGVIWPGRNDCHNSVDDCLKDNGLNSPPHPRLNHPDDDFLYDPWLGFP